jgi:hypothetical protein
MRGTRWRDAFEDLANDRRSSKSFGGSRQAARIS